MLIAFKSLIFLLLVFTPDLQLSWVRHGDDSRLKASLDGYNTELASCLASGLSIRLRFEFALCKKRSLWFDDCKPVRTAISSVEFDPISETYAVTTDLLGDTELPGVERLPDSARAIEVASGRSDISLNWLAGEDAPADFSNHVFKGRVYAECRGEYSASMKRLSYILSFGMVRSSGFDSEWVEFKR